MFIIRAVVWSLKQKLYQIRYSNRRFKYHGIIQRDASELGAYDGLNICSRFRRKGGRAELRFFTLFISLDSLQTACGGQKLHTQADCMDQRWLETVVVLKAVFVATDESAVFRPGGTRTTTTVVVGLPSPIVYPDRPHRCRRVDDAINKRG